MQQINMTMSFRAAWRFGVPHLAGQGVTLSFVGEREGWIVRHRVLGEVARVYQPQSVRESGGVPRRAESRYPRRARRRLTC